MSGPRSSFITSRIEDGAEQASDLGRSFIASTMEDNAEKENGFGCIDY